MSKYKSLSRNYRFEINWWPVVQFLVMAEYIASAGFIYYNWSVNNIYPLTLWDSNVFFGFYVTTAVGFTLATCLLKSRFAQWNSPIWRFVRQAYLCILWIEFHGIAYFFYDIQYLVAEVGLAYGKKKSKLKTAKANQSNDLLLIPSSL